MIGTLAHLMLGNPAFEIVGASGVVAAVGTEENIHPSFHHLYYFNLKIKTFGNIGLLF